MNIRRFRRPKFWSPASIDGLVLWIDGDEVMRGGPVMRVGFQNLAALVLLALVVGLSSCSTTTSDPAKNARNAGLNAAGVAALNESAKVLGTADVQALLSVAHSEASGGKADWQQAAAQGLWSQANGATVSDAYSAIVTAYSAGKASQTAKMAEAVAAAPLANGVPPADVANAIATVISTAAGAPPAK